MATRDQVYIDIITETRNSITGLKKLVTGLGAAYAAYKTVEQIAKKALDAAKYAAEINQIQRAFHSMAESVGEDAESVISQLGAMAGGTISKLDLLKSASRAALFDLPIDKIDELMQIARASATATGESVQYMFDSIVTGIGRSSPMILDNLGLTIKIGDANEQYARSIGKTVEQLTAAEKKQALLNAVLESGTTIMERVGEAGQEITDAERWQILQTSVKNLKGEIGRGLLPAFRSVASISTEFANALEEIVRQRNIMKDLGSDAYSTAEKIEALNKEIKELSEPSTMKYYGGAEGMRITALKEQRDALVNLQKAEAAREMAKSRQDEEAQKIAEQEEEQAREAEARAKRLQEYLETLNDAYGQTEKGQIDALKTAIAYWEDQLPYADKTKGKIIEILKTLKEELAAIQDDWVRLDSVIEPPIEEIVYGFQEASREALGLTDIMSGFYDELNSRESIIEDTTEDLKDLADIIRNQTVPAYELLGKVIKDYAEQASGAVKDYHEQIVDQAQTAVGYLGNIWDNYYERQLQNEELTDEQRKEILRKQAEAAKAFALFNATVDTAQAVVKALASAAPPASYVLAGLASAAGLAQVAAIVSTPMPALAEGGIVTQPTTALLGERGPEAVIPLSRYGGAGNVINNYYNIRGSVIAEKQLQAFAGKGFMRLLHGR